MLRSMDCDENENSSVYNSVDENDARATTAALNSTILNYYKKFGKKRDLEQYFSLSTAQSDVRDPSSLFWRRMKSQSDSDSERKSEESPAEICRISIQCSIPEPDPCSSQDEFNKTKSDSESPPIITEDAVVNTSHQSDDESVKSDDNNSQKSMDATFDTSMNKPLSPTSSITSQRKLEWDSLADVGYGNESDRKSSATSLSTLERLALKQQYSNNDADNLAIGQPTAHSTPQEDTEVKSKGKKLTKSTKIYTQDIDSVEVNVPSTSHTNPPQAINVNLTKHISFNVDKSGSVTVENVQKDVDIQPKKVSVEIEVAPEVTNKESQTSLTRSKDTSSDVLRDQQVFTPYGQGIPVLINLNKLKKRTKRKTFRTVKKKLKIRKQLQKDKENLPMHEKSGEQVSEAESFEYMPGHIYNQKQLRKSQPSTSNTVGNKSSLESSGVLTTDSSKASKHSLTKDLDKSINLLKLAIQKRQDDSELKRKLIKEIVKKLLNSNYRDDESTTEFLSGISFSNKKLGLSESNQTTTSTSDTGDKISMPRPKKSILRIDKFNSQPIASTSQSAPNLPSASNSTKPVTSSLRKASNTPNTESDGSSKGRYSSDTAFAKTSSEELYEKYLDALRREEAYKRHLRDKEIFMKQKLVRSETALKMPENVNVKSQTKLKDLMRDLTRNNYDDGSGDASKLEGVSGSNANLDRVIVRKQRSHSVFTLSSGNSEHQSCSYRPQNIQVQPPKMDQCPQEHYACCPLHSYKETTNSSAQVNICPQEEYVVDQNNYCPRIMPVERNDNSVDVRCLCPGNEHLTCMPGTSNDYLPPKCNCINNKAIQSQDPSNANIRCGSFTCPQEANKTNLKVTSSSFKCPRIKPTKCSQTCVPLLSRKSSDKSMGSCFCEINMARSNTACENNRVIHEATRLVQTDMSINPGIAEPTISDINVITDAECVTLVGENCRQVSKFTMQDSEERILSVISPVDDIKPKRILRGEGGNFNTDSNENNYAIPIKGTNMTLMVSLDSGNNKHPVEATCGCASKALQADVVICDREVSCPNEASHPSNIQEEEIEPCYQNYPTDNKCDCNSPKCFCNKDKNPVAPPQPKPSCCDNDEKEIEPCYQNYPTDKKCDCKSPKCFCNKDKNPVAPSSPKPMRCGNDEKEIEPCYQNYPTDNKCDCKSPKCFCNKDKNPVAPPPSKPSCCDKDEKEIEPCYQNYPSDKKCDCKSPKCFCNKDFGCNTDPVVSPPPPEPLGCGKDEKEIEPCYQNYPPEKKCDCKSPKCFCNKDFGCNTDPIVSPPPPEPLRCGNDEKEIEPCYQNYPLEKKCDCKSPKCFCNKDFGCNTDPVVSPPPPKSSPCQNCPPGKTCDCNSKNPCAPPAPDVSCRPKKTRRNACDSEQERSCDQNVNSGSSSESTCCNTKTKNVKNTCKSDCSSDGTYYKANSKPCNMDPNDDVVLNLIKDITKRYTKKDLQNNEKKKCFKEIMRILNYLLDTDQPDPYKRKRVINISTCALNNEKKKCERRCNSDCKSCKVTSTVECSANSEPSCTCGNTNRCSSCKTKSVKSSCVKCGKNNRCTCGKKNREPECRVSEKRCNCGNKVCFNKGCLSKAKSVTVCQTESSDLPMSTDIPCTSSDSATCKVLNKIKKECEKYHKKRCSCYGTRKCECSSTTSVNCDSCKRVHYCYCRTHKCKGCRPRSAMEKLRKKCVAYNLIIQTSDSVISEERTCQNTCTPLKNIVVKVPPKRHCVDVPFREMATKIESRMPCAPRCIPRCRQPKCVPNVCDSEVLSSADDYARKAQMYTVREYLERNRPDFVQQCTRRQEGLRLIHESRAQEVCMEPPGCNMVFYNPTRCDDPCGMYCGPNLVQMTCNPCIQTLPTETCFECQPICQQTEVARFASERTMQRQLLSKHLQRLARPAALSALTDEDLRLLAKQMGIKRKRHSVPNKIISEEEMKKHSEKIYKTLSEVVQRKEEAKKERVKKTNLLMASMFNKNLQKMTLNGAVNLSNSNKVVQI